jgi:chorismate mutase
VGLLTGLLTLPLAPVRGTVWMADQLLHQAEREYYDPDRIRRQLEEVDAARARGVLADAEADDLEEQLLERLMAGSQRSDNRKV